MSELRVVEIYPNLLVREDGMVQNINPHKRARQLSIGWNMGTLCGRGCYRVTRQTGISVDLRVHRLVAMAFIPNPKNLPYVDHIDGNGSNNCVSNLRWVDSRTNQNNQKRHREGKVVGVYYDKRHKAKASPWTSKIKYEGHNLSLGVYKTQELASQAYQKALKNIQEGRHPRCDQE